MDQWRVRLFAYLRERHGESVEITAEPTALGVLTALQNAGIDTRACRLAVNNEFSRADSQIAVGDELALIPPVSGG